MVQFIKFLITQFYLKIYLTTLCSGRFVVTFFILPETENRSLEDIELHFSNDKISLWHIHIRVNAHNSNTTK